MDSQTIDKPCPLCHTNQVMLCSDSNNPMKSLAKCRHCGCTAPLEIWNKYRSRGRLQNIMGDDLNGYELIVNDDQWWVFHKWQQGVCLGAMLIEKKDKTLEEALDWLLEDTKREPNIFDR